MNVESFLEHSTTHTQFSFIKCLSIISNQRSVDVSLLNVQVFVRSIPTANRYPWERFNVMKTIQIEEKQREKFARKTKSFQAHLQKKRKDQITPRLN